MLDQPIGDAQDRFRRAVVRLQTHDLGARVVLLEGEDLGDVRSAPSVDRLVVIAHDAQVAVPIRQLAQDLVLGFVGVLVLVHVHVTEPLPKFLAYFLVVLQQAQGLEQQVVEI